VHDILATSDQLQDPPPLCLRKPPVAVLWKELAVSFTTSQPDPFVGQGQINGGLVRRQPINSIVPSRVGNSFAKFQRRFTFADVPSIEQMAAQPTSTLFPLSRLRRDSPRSSFGKPAGQVPRHTPLDEPTTPTKSRLRGAEKQSRSYIAGGNGVSRESRSGDNVGKPDRGVKTTYPTGEDDDEEGNGNKVGQGEESINEGKAPGIGLTESAAAALDHSPLTLPDWSPASTAISPGFSPSGDSDSAVFDTPITIPSANSPTATSNGLFPSLSAPNALPPLAEAASSDADDLLTELDDTPCRRQTTRPPLPRQSDFIRSNKDDSTLSVEDDEEVDDAKPDDFVRSDEEYSTRPIEKDEEVDDAKLDETSSGNRNVDAEPEVLLYYYDDKSEESMDRLRHKLLALSEFSVPVKLFKCARKQTTIGRSHPLTQNNPEWKDWTGSCFQKSKTQKDATKLLEELLTCLEKPIHCHGSRKCGSVYGFTRSDAQRDAAPASECSPGFIKIGKGDVDPSQRYDIIRDKCGYEPTILFKVDMPCAAKLMETLVHLDLYEHRRLDLSCSNHKGKNCQSKHQEWFEVDLEKAVVTVMKWQRFSTCQPYFGQGYLKSFWQKEVRDAQLERLMRAAKNEISPGIEGGWTVRMNQAIARQKAGDCHVSLGDISMKVGLVDGQEASLLVLHSSQHHLDGMLADGLSAGMAALSIGQKAR
jgi:hypothetical protein